MQLVALRHLGQLTFLFSGINSKLSEFVAGIKVSATKIFFSLGAHVVYPKAG